MEHRMVKPYSKEETMAFAKTVLQGEFDCGIENIEYIGGGSYGYVYLCKINKAPYKVIMKACRVDGMCSQEANAIKMLSIDSPIPLPEIYFTYYCNDEIPLDFICEEYIEGDNCLNPKYLRKLPRTKKNFANKIVDTMAVWHSKTNDKFGLLESAECDTWIDYYKPFAYDILQSARENNMDKSILQIMEEAFKHFDYIFSEPIKEAVLIHGDLNVANIMADKHLNPVAIIDPLESRWADKEYDLFQLRNLTGESFKLYETYKKKYPVSEKCDIKCAFYGLFNEVYCNIMAGGAYAFLLKPVAKRMKDELKKAGL